MKINRENTKEDIITLVSIAILRFIVGVGMIHLVANHFFYNNFGTDTITLAQSVSIYIALITVKFCLGEKNELG